MKQEPQTGCVRFLISQFTDRYLGDFLSALYICISVHDVNVLDFSRDKISFPVIFPEERSDSAQNFRMYTLRIYKCFSIVSVCKIYGCHYLSHCLL